MKALELNKRMSELVKSERKITHEILQLINLAYDQKTYLELGYSSLFDWLVVGHGYSESAAQRRIQAAKLLRAVPEISEKIENGEVNLTTLSRTQAFLAAQEKISGEKVSAEDKSKLLKLIEKKTSKETEKVLTALLPEASVEIQSTTQARLERALNLSEEGLKDLERAKEILSHVIPDGNVSALIEYLLKDFLKRKGPLRKPASVRKEKNLSQKQISADEKKDLASKSQTYEMETRNLVQGNQAFEEEPMSKSQITAVTAKRCVNKPQGRKAIPVQVRRLVFQRAQGKCEYKNHLTGKICGSSHQAQVDHVDPHALGGSDELENLRCLCANHNRFRAEKTFGPWKPKS